LRDILPEMKTLFLFTKTFPFGESEQYVENELPVLANHFEKIFIYPTDWFSKDTNHNRKIPSNVEVLHFNPQLPRYKNTFSDYLSSFKLILTELFHSRSVFSELKRIKYLFSIAIHQLYTARFFGDYLKKNHSTDSCFFYGYWNHGSSILLSILKKNKTIQSFVTRAHSIDLYYYDWTYYEFKVPPFEYIKFNSADKIITVSKHAEEFFKKKYPHWKNKVISSYLGISDMGVNHCKPDVFTLVTCSNLSLNKRLLELAKAIKKLDFPLEWVHFGEGEQRKEIEEISNTLPQNKKITLTGNKPNEEIRNYLLKKPADLFLNLSIVEGLPVAIMEAISAGIPVIATHVYGNPEIAVNNYTGFTIPADFTTKMLADGITKIYSDKELQLKLRVNAREHYIMNFTAEKNYTSFSKELLNYPNKIN
jgi:colanic acid/amylovoran biosynthesis glycosyltransferase